MRPSGYDRVFSNDRTACPEYCDGRYREQFVPRAETDSLGKAFQEMIAYLQEIVQMATAIASGDFQQNLTLRAIRIFYSHAFQEIQYSAGRLLKFNKAQNY